MGYRYPRVVPIRASSKTRCRGTYWSISISQIYTGFLPLAGGLSLRDRISSVIVAVNNNVCRPCSAEGIASRHSDKSSAKESVRSLSASSRTTNLVRRSPHMVSSPDDLMWSANRPGVAMTMCGRWARDIACVLISAPPINKQSLIFCGEPKA